MELKIINPNHNSKSFRERSEFVIIRPTKEVRDILNVIHRISEAHCGPTIQKVIAGSFVVNLLLDKPLESNDIDIWINHSFLSFNFRDGIEARPQVYAYNRTTGFEDIPKTIQYIPVVPEGFNEYTILNTFDHTLCMAGWAIGSDYVVVHRDIHKILHKGKPLGHLRRKVRMNRISKYEKYYHTPATQLFPEIDSVESWEGLDEYEELELPRNLASTIEDLGSWIVNPRPYRADPFSI